MFKKMKYSFSFFFIMILLLAGCGIPDYPYLAPPVVTNKSDNSIVYTAGFSNASDNNPQYFQGYVFNYRFFNTEEELIVFVNSIANADGREDLKNYFSLYGEDQGVTIDSAPLLKIDLNDRSEDFSIQVDFRNDILNPDTSGYGSIITWAVSGTIYTIDLKRHIIQNRIDNPLKFEYRDRSFKKNDFYETDSDIPSDYQNSGSLYLSLYVLSFGRDDNGSPLFSVPVELGRFYFPSDY